GVADTAVRALEAGVDALCVGHDLGEDAVEDIVAALSTRVDSERLAEAAARVERLADWARHPTAGAPDRAAAADAARRALEVAGDVSLGGAASVVELRPVANIA